MGPESSRSDPPADDMQAAGVVKWVTLRDCMALMWLRSRLHSEVRPPPAASVANEAALTRKHSVRRSSASRTKQPCSSEGGFGW